MDPFESSSMVHSGATGLTDDWREKVASPYNATSLQSLALDPRTPNRSVRLHPPTTPALRVVVPPRSSLSVCNSIAHLSHVDLQSIFQFEDIPINTFTLPKVENGSRNYPGVKDLPLHIRPNFRNEFIRFVIKHVANSKLPWMNPDLDSLQAMYNIVYPEFPARIRHSDAVYHPVGNLLLAVP